MKDIRCGCCRALLFRMASAPSAPAIEIKCRRCGTINHLRPPEPAPERDSPTAPDTEPGPCAGNCITSTPSPG
ncbi:Com family DNA-binding transcriptional regulator [Microvirga tunisiensis]|uniref:Com family DNA-binding transcriptional regulator n=1 Tax=Pannonibacter tanglangensis TaxID=2750084 RepID=A0A7X5J6X1_9HYPH|nr:Com family DNA-binding transcriptional regulator [Pannonibacter sp. XCT-53]